MIVRYYDKDGKQHSILFKPGQPVFIASEIGNTGEFATFRVDERKSYNKTVSDWTTSGKIEISVTPERGMTIRPKRSDIIEIGPSVFDPNYI